MTMKLKNYLIALVSLATLTGCDMMTEDEDTTNCGLFVTFKYDYNLQRADMFGDHVGGVTLYVSAPTRRTTSRQWHVCSMDSTPTPCRYSTCPTASIAS